MVDPQNNTTFAKYTQGIENPIVCMFSGHCSIPTKAVELLKRRLRQIKRWCRDGGGAGEIGGSKRSRRGNDEYGHHQSTPVWSAPPPPGHPWSSLPAHRYQAQRDHHVGRTHWKFAQSSICPRAECVFKQSNIGRHFD